MTAETTGPPHNRDAVLASLGRASTPPVPARDDGPTLGRLTGLLARVEPGSVLLVGTGTTAARLRTLKPVIPAVPGITAEIAAHPEVDLLVVEARAFRSGPWRSADSHQSRHLAEEIFEAGRRVRERGAQALFVPDPSPTGTMSARLMSTFTADLGAVPAADCEEGAAQSELWRLLVAQATETKPHSDSFEEPRI